MNGSVLSWGAYQLRAHAMRVQSRGAWLSHYVVVLDGEQLHAASLHNTFDSQDEALFQARQHALRWAKAHEEELLGVAEARRWSGFAPL